MQRYIAQRVMLAVPTIFFVVFATFAMVRFVPGDVVELILAENPYATEQDKEDLRKRLGLDQPIPIQFARYSFNLIRGDLGVSHWTNRPVSQELRSRLPITLEFGLLAVVLGLFVAIPVGVISAIRQDTFADYFGRSFAILAISIPYFFTATLLVIFPVMWFGWAPPLTYVRWLENPFGHMYYMFFPALILGVNLSGSVMRMTRTMLLEVMRQDYIRTAYSKGLTERTVLVRHAMKNALIPVITIIGLQVGTALSGTLIIEVIFNMPGVGRYFISSILARDYPSVQGVVLVLATVVIFVNLAVDLIYAMIDPRISYS